MSNCKYIKREGESCTLNNNCKYPNCKQMRHAQQNLEDAWYGIYDEQEQEYQNELDAIMKEYGCTLEEAEEIYEERNE